MALFNLRIEGEVVGKPRPRATTINGHAHIYTPSSGRAFEYKVATAFRRAYSNYEPSTKPVAVHIEVHYPLLKGDYRKNGEPNGSGIRKLAGTELPAKKPDIDNVAKSILDGLNKVAWVDDTQVVRLSVSKVYSKEAYTLVDIIEIE